MSYENSEGMEYLKSLLKENVSVPSEILASIFSVPQKTVEELAREAHKAAAEANPPLSWDYVLAFRVGDEDKIRKPTEKEVRLRQDNERGYDKEWSEGMSERKYFCQIILQTQRELEAARLTTKAFKSQDGKYAFLIVGITEDSLHKWADERNTDLEIDAREACLQGRRHEFPLAIRTYLGEQDNAGKVNLPLENWEHMYCQYNPKAEKVIYKHYPRVRGDPNSIKTVFDEKTRLRIIYETIIADKGEGGAEVEIQAHIASASHPLIACFPLHNPVQLEEFSKNWVQNWNIRDCITVPLQDIRSYFGEPIAFYYGFMMFYLRWLIWPTIVGFGFFIAQLGYGRVDIPGLFVMSLFIIFWCVAFVDFWLRQESRYRLLWGMTKFETKAVARPEFKGEWQHDRVTGLWVEDYSILMRFVKGSFVFSGLGVWMAGCVVAVVYVLLFRDANPTDLGLKVGLGVTNGVMIAFFDTVYQYASRFGNEWENHRTEQDFQDALISKSFIFKFFNSFSSLFYLSFIRPFAKGEAYYIQNYPDVCTDCVATDPDTGDKYPICAASGQSSYSTSDFDCCIGDDGASCTKAEVQKDINTLVLKDLQLQLATLFVTAIVIQNTVEVLLPYIFGKIRERQEQREANERQEPIPPKSDAEEQMHLTPVANTIDDMSEMIIQFGYVTMFVVGLPITPLLAFINNIIELKVDGYKIVKESQRPHPNGSSGLGAWNGVLSFFSLISVGTNVALITWRTEVVRELISEDSTMKWVFFSLVCIGLSILVAAEKWAIPDVPLEVLQGVERQRLIENVLVLGAHIDMDEDEPPRKDEEVPEFAFDPTKEFINPASLPPIPLGDLRQLAEKETIAIEP